MRKAKVTIDNEELQTASDMLRALSHPLRLQILDYIDKSKQVNVNKIYNALKLEQSITSQHLRILRLTGLVTTVRDGKMIYYAVDYDKLALVVKALDGFLDSSRKSE
jgi:ArsR family transcriptional regulator